jgi:glycosyltransferase involved in cell wall biosynthesis
VLRVLALIPGFPDRAEAWPPSLLLERLAERVDLTVGTWSYPDRARPYWHRQAHIVPLRRLRHTALSSWAALLPRPELVHAFWALQPGALGAALASAWRVPLVVSALGGEVVHLPEVGFGSAGSAWHRALARLSLSRARVVVAGSQLQLEACRRLAPVPRARVLPVGVHERFQPLPTNPTRGRIALLAVGSLVPVKRTGLLLEALALLPSSFSLTIVGDGPQREALGARARSLGVHSRVHFQGELEGEGVLEALRQADVFVHASAHEGGAVALLEALACARPVVSTAVGAAPELLADGAGELAEPTPAALARAVMQVAEGLETKYRAAAMRASAQVRQHFGVEAVARSLVALYGELSA